MYHLRTHYYPHQWLFGTDLTTHMFSSSSVCVSSAISSQILRSSIPNISLPNNTLYGSCLQALSVTVITRVLCLRNVLYPARIICFLIRTSITSIISRFTRATSEPKTTSLYADNSLYPTWLFITGFTRAVERFYIYYSGYTM